MSAKDETEAASTFGLSTGVGLVVANMIGAGVFISAGFMAQDLDPGQILLSWLMGALIALSGSVAYAQIARINGRSGGEYRYLHDYLHPYVGYLAGWASLLVGFAAPVAIDAYAAGAFFEKIGSHLSPRTFGTLAILGLTLVHGIRLSWSQSVQNLLVNLKFLFIIIFIGFGLILGSGSWPDWQPVHASPRFPLKAFLENQYWIAFAFSGWNAAIYAAGEFSRPRHDVSRAMLWGCALVALVYMAVNWIFVANLAPEQASAVFEHEKTRITLAHVVMENLVGSAGATAVSLVAILVFLSALSAMTLVGPRVYASMADDGLLPAAFRSQSGRPPLFAVLIQGSLALFLLHTETVLDVVKSSSAVLMVFSMLTALTLFFSAIQRSPGSCRPTPLSLAAALFYILAVAVILYVGFLSSRAVLITFMSILAIGTAGYLSTKPMKRAA